MDMLRAGMELENRILAGEFGPSGSRFPSVRELAETIPCSYVTAVRTAEWLRERGLLMISGRNHYVTTGRCDLDSELEKRLRENRRPTFGVLFNAIDNNYYAMMSTQLYFALRAKGYDLVIMINDAGREQEQKQINTMLEMGLSGVFFFPHMRFKNQKIFETFPLPLVAIGRQINQFSRSTVTVNNYSVGRLAAHHLISCGYQDFLYIGHSQSRPMVDQRMKGFTDTLRQEGVPIAQENRWVVDDENLSDSMDAMLDRLLHLQQPTGVFCYHDLIAVALLQTCLRHGISVPEKLGIIGCDDLPITTATTPTLSTIHYPYTRISQMAVEMMLSELDGTSSRGQYMEMQPRLMERQSTACIAG